MAADLDSNKCTSTNVLDDTYSAMRCTTTGAKTTRLMHPSLSLRSETWSTTMARMPPIRRKEFMVPRPPPRSKAFYLLFASARRRGCSSEVFIRPVIALTWKLVVFALLMASILATLYEHYPQITSAAITIIGSLLFVLSTECVVGFQSNLLITDEPVRAFADAVRFATVISLRNLDSNNMTLYTLCASTAVGPQKLLFDARHVRWTVISLVFSLSSTMRTI